MGRILILDILQLVPDQELLYLPIAPNFTHDSNDPQQRHKFDKKNPANPFHVITHPILTIKNQLILTELLHFKYCREYSRLSQQSDT